MMIGTSVFNQSNTLVDLAASGKLISAIVSEVSTATTIIDISTVPGYVTGDRLVVLAAHLETSGDAVTTLQGTDSAPGFSMTFRMLVNRVPRYLGPILQMLKADEDLEVSGTAGNTNGTVWACLAKDFSPYKNDLNIDDGV